LWGRQEQNTNISIDVGLRPGRHALGRLPASHGSDGGVVREETILRRASRNPKGRSRTNKKITNSAHKNVVLSLVERGGEVRSYHVVGRAVGELIPIREAQVMTDTTSWDKHMNKDGRFVSHDRVDHSKHKYARYGRGPPRHPHQHSGRLLDRKSVV